MGLFSEAVANYRERQLPIYQQTAFYIGKWRVEPSLNRLSCDGQEQTLVPKVMALLTALVEGEGTPLSREQLMAQVWPGQVVADSSLYQAIAQLRKALGDSSSNPSYIELVSGKGYRLIADVTPAKYQSHPLKYVQIAALALLAVFAITALLLLRETKQTTQIDTDGIEINSITFVDLELPSAAQGSIKGFNQVLLSQLTRIDDLTVINLSSPAKDYDTDAVISGNVTTGEIGTQVYLKVQLTGSNQVLWADTLHSPNSDLLTLQNQVLQRLLTTLDKKHDNALVAGNQVNQRSFEQHLLARHFWQQRTPESLHKAIGLYHELQKSGQLFPLAAVGLCDAYHFLHIYDDWELVSAMQKCEPLLQQALAANPSLGEAVAAQALLNSSQGNNRAAIELFERAIALAPNYAVGKMWYANLLRDSGQFSEALALSKQAFELAPGDPSINRSLAYSHLTLSQFADARYYYQRGLALDPNYPVQPLHAIDFLPLNVQLAQNLLRWKQDNQQQYAKMAYAQMRMVQLELSLGRISHAQHLFEKIDHQQINPSFMLYMRASIATAMGDLTSAGDLLQQRMQMFPGQRRFVMPYLAILMHRGETQTVHQTLLQTWPELASERLQVSRDNQYLLVFYLRVLTELGLRQQAVAIAAKLSSWFTENPPGVDPYYIAFLSHQGDASVPHKLVQMLQAGWLPDYNEDMLSVANLRQLFLDASLSVENFEQALQNNREQVLAEL